MSKLTNFKAQLAGPEVFRDICYILSSINKTCYIGTKYRDPDSDPDSSVQNEPELILVATNPNQSLDFWAHLTDQCMLSEISLLEKQWMELKSDSLYHAFKNQLDLVNLPKIELSVIRRTNLKYVTLSNEEGDVRSQEQEQEQEQGDIESDTSRVLSFKWSAAHERSDSTSKDVEQRIYAEHVLDSNFKPEPMIGGIQLWADLTVNHANQIASVCEQYRQMDPKLTVAIQSSGLLTLSCIAADMTAETSWKVEFAEQLDKSQQSDSTAPDTVESVISSRDWCKVFQCRKICKRMIVGAQNRGSVIVYGFLKSTRITSGNDLITFYLANRSER